MHIHTYLSKKLYRFVRKLHLGDHPVLEEKSAVSQRKDI